MVWGYLEGCSYLMVWLGLEGLFLSWLVGVGCGLEVLGFFYMYFFVRLFECFDEAAVGCFRVSNLNGDKVEVLGFLVRLF